MTRKPHLLALAAALIVPRVAHAQDVGQINQIVKFIRPAGLVIAGLAIAAAVLSIRFINSFTTRFSTRFSDRRLLAQQTNTILRFVVYMITVVIVISSVFELRQEALLAIGGAFIVVLGFGFKDLASSVLGGITILFDRPFQVGDRVTVAGFYGEIRSIGLRSVRMVTLDDSTVTIPNNKFLTEIAVSGNAGALDMQIVMDFYVALDADVQEAKRIVYEAVRTSRFVYLEKPVVVLVNEVVEANYIATRLRAKAYVLDVHYEKAFETDVTLRVKQAFNERGVRPPALLYSPASDVRQRATHN